MKPFAILPLLVLLTGCATVDRAQWLDTHALWRLVAQSDLIVSGRLEVPKRTMRKAMAGGDSKPVVLVLWIDEIQKGEWHDPDRVDIHYYVEECWYRPSPKDILKMNRQRVIAFLSLPEDKTLSAHSIEELHKLRSYDAFFAGITPQSFSRFSRARLVAIRSEVAAQRKMLSDFSSNTSTNDFHNYDTVKKLIDTMVIGEKEQKQSLAKLEELGPSAVPAIITLMDDRRPLPRKQMSLGNKAPNAFEGTRFYGPELVVDALAAILNQLTGQSFGSIYNGGSEAERRRTIDGWRVYLHYLRINGPPPWPWKMNREDQSWQGNGGGRTKG